MKQSSLFDHLLYSTISPRVLFLNTYGGREMQWPNPYIGSDLVRKIKRTGVLNLFDIDGTLAMDGEPSVEELAARQTVRSLANRMGASVFISARTPELMMESREYSRSVYMGFTRPPPRAGRDVEFGDFRVEVPLEDERAFSYVVGGAHALLSMGIEGPLIRRDGGYVLDREYEDTFADRVCRRKWRNILHLVLNEDKNGDIALALADIEFSSNYLAGKTDVAPLPYRVQLDWRGRSALRTKMRVKRRLARLFAQHPEMNVRFVDESNPAMDRYTLYIVHEAVRKEKMFERLVASILDVTYMQPSDLSVNIFGDTLTDLRQIYAGGLKFGRAYDGDMVRMNFVLAGGSRLSVPIQGAITSFGGEDLDWLHRLLEKTDRPGVYNVQIENAPRGSRQFVLCDEVFPDTVGPESIRAYFESDLALQCV